MERIMLDDNRSPVPGLAGGTRVRYSPMQPEFFSIRFIGQEGRLAGSVEAHHRHCFVEFACGTVLLVQVRDVEPLY